MTLETCYRLKTRTRRSIRTLRIGSVTLLLFACLCSRATSSLAADITETTIDNFLRVLNDPTVAAIAPSNTPAPPPSATPGKGGTPPQFSPLLASLTVPEQSAIDASAKQNGFSSASEWATQGDAIAKAYICVQMMDEDAKLTDELRQETNPDVKVLLQQLLTNLHDTLKNAGCASFSSASLTAVRNRLQALNDIFPVVSSTPSPDRPSPAASAQ
jgi:hypothetical protein